MAQDAETTRAKVQKRTISNPSSLPKLTKKPQPRQNLPAITRKPQPDVKRLPQLTQRPDSESITKRPHQAPEPHDYSHSGGQALQNYRQSKAHQEHLRLVKLAREIIRTHANTPLPGVVGDTKGDLERYTADAYKVGNGYLNALSDAQEAHGNYLEKQAADAKKAENDKYSGSPGGLISGFIHMKGPVAATIKGAGDAVAKASTIDTSKLAPGLKQIGEFTNKIVPNAGRELVDLPANAIPSTYNTFKPAVEGALTGKWSELLKGQKESGKRLGQPYGQLVKDPIGTVEHHPISSYLMLAGPVKAADRLAGRIEQGAYPHIENRVTETTKEVLKDHPQAPLPGSAKFKTVVDRANKASKLEDHGATPGERQAAMAAKNRILNNAHLRETPTDGIKPTQIKAKETTSSSKRTLTSVPSRPYQHIEIRLPGTAAKQIVLPRQGALAYRLQKTRTKNITRMSDNEIGHRADETFYTSVNQSRQDAYDAIANHQHTHPDATPKELEQVAKDQLEKSRTFYRDQSAMDMALRDKNGKLRIFHGGKFDDASKFIERWGQNLVNQHKDVNLKEYEHNGKTLKGIYHSNDAQTLAPYVLKTGPNKGKTILAPKIAIDRLRDHDSYLHQTTTSAILQGVSGTFRRTVLPFSPKWLANNYTEAALRGAINGVGPASARASSVFYKSLSETGKKEFDQLVKSVGHGGMQRQLLQEGSKWEEKLAETTHWKAGERITKFGQMKGPKAAMHLFDTLTDVSFHHLNGHMENAVHMGMAGRVLRRHPLMTKEVLKVTHDAMNPEGKSAVVQRNNIIALGREVDRMFGKYGKFTPGQRRSIATWTPFIPWTLNAVHFITQHLPNDHPLVAALIADAHQSSQEWRNKHGLSYFVDGKLPPFLQGAIPGNQGSHWMIFSQGTPFSVGGDPTGTFANNFNPLGSTIQANLEGLDWKGDKLKHDSPGHRLETAVLSLLEGTTPVGYAVGRVAGRAGSQPNENLQNWANPFHPIKGKAASTAPQKTSGLYGKKSSSPSLFHGKSGGTPSLFGG